MTFPHASEESRTRERLLRARLAEVCPPKLMAHMDRVVEVADELARRWELDVALARYMAQAHDVVRHLSDEAWLARAQEYGIAIGEVERRSEEHTSELQSRENLVCRRLLEIKKARAS